jgi:deoxyribodipyrimidine photo-lyase
MTRDSEPVQVVWFKRDLRVTDHAPLAHASAAGPVLPLYVVEPQLWALADASARQWRFVRETLTDLRVRLAALGQPLIVRVGGVESVLATLHEQVGIAAVWSHEETGNDWTYARDRRVRQWLAARDIPWFETPSGGVVRRLRSRDGWARRWQAAMRAPPAHPAGVWPLRAELEPGHLPTPGDLALATDGCTAPQAGGRTAAEARLHRFLQEDGRAYAKGISSPLTAAEAGSRMSPYLAFGVMSLRELVQACEARRAQAPHGWAMSLRAFAARLSWRDHFIQKLESEPALEFRNLHPAYDGLRPEPGDAALLEAWSAGQTGVPFVDACMRSLRATGWLNFRMRAMLMSFASYQLWLPWRAPGEHLARQFTDYEPGIHWPQVQMQSGTTGINTIRIYNPVKQGLDHDPTGIFVRRWVPELGVVPDAWVHTPWEWPAAGAMLEGRYPRPVVDLAATARLARERTWAARRAPGYRELADEIQRRHGSRRSGIADRGRRRSAPAPEGHASKGVGVGGGRSGGTHRSAPAAQLDLDLG